MAPFSVRAVHSDAEETVTWARGGWRYPLARSRLFAIGDGVVKIGIGGEARGFSCGERSCRARTGMPETHTMCPQWKGGPPR